MSSAPEYQVERLAAHHNRPAFSCGVPALDAYLHRQAGQEQRRLVTVVYVMVPVDDPTIVVGYYTLSSCEVEPTDLPEAFVSRLPRYPALPAILLGRLALDHRYRGQKLGAALLANALERARTVAQQAGSVAVLVDAKNDSARAFYEHHGFQILTSRPGRLFLPMNTIRL